MFAALLCASSSRISTHAPAGGATALSDLVDAVREISTHAPAGGATVGDCTVRAIAKGFLLTPLREGRPTRCGQYHRAAQYFYSRPCGRGDRRRRVAGDKQRQFLLTPLREGRPALVNHNDAGRIISTHAPAGGATCSATVAVAIVLPFLLTPLREGRHSFPVSRYSPFAISTHAPAGGATISSAPASGPRSNFYSRPCGRGDDQAEGFCAKMAVFLLTPLREGRRSPERRNTGFLPYFYSRPCGRGDACELQAAVAAVLFLLTPLREGRPVKQDGAFAGYAISTHAPAGGATCLHRHHR